MALAQRHMLWIDGVGGYLVVAGPRLILGQKRPRAECDVALAANIRSQHASLKHDGEAWLIEPRGDTWLDGQAIREPTILPSEATIRLASDVSLRFRQPHPLSQSAVLETTSGHRTDPSADAVLLWIDTLVLGPSSQAHVRCHDLKEPLVLYRTEGQTSMTALSPQGLEIEGHRVGERAIVSPGMSIRSEGLRWTIVPV
jgi:hypothetical protein